MNRGSAPYKYYPGPLPVSITQPNFLNSLLRFLRDEFSSVARGQENIWYMPVLNEEPAKLSEGLLAYADGTNWDPGSGKGVYVYEGASWVKL